jgi:hypothetical protein
MPRSNLRAWPLLVLALVALLAWLAWPSADGGDADAPVVDDPAAPERVARLRTPLALPTGPAAGITGVVRDGGGAPLPGAHVCAFPRGGLLALADVHTAACAEAEADGRYAIEALLPGRWLVHASAAEHQPAGWPGPGGRSDLFLRPGETRTGVDLVLAPGGALLTGVVKDITGGVVEGAQVTNFEVSFHFEPPGGLAAARTDAAGAFSLWLRPGSTPVFAEAEGYASGLSFAAAPGQGVQIVLTPEAVLVGRVVEAGGGGPVAGARVEVSADMSEGGYGLATATTTGADGRFRLGRLMPGRYKPTAIADGRYGEAAFAVALGLGEVSGELEIAVHPAAQLSGQVLYAGSREPCLNGNVALNSLSNAPPAFAALEPDGRVHFPALLPGAYDVMIQCFGAVTPPAPGRLEVATEPIEQVWEVERGQAIRGVVVDASGAPVSGVSLSAVMLVPASQVALSGGGFDEATDAAGRFEVAGLSAGTYALQPFAEGFAPPREPVSVELPAGRDVDDVRVTLPPQGSVRGLVVDDRGDPVGGVQVTAMGEFSGGAQSSGDGRFEIRGLYPGDYQVRADRVDITPPMPDGPPPGVPVRVDVDRPAEVRLTVPAARGELRGHVLDHDGGPATDAYVVAVREPEVSGPESAETRAMARWAGGNTSVLVDQDGAFTVGKLADGQYTLRAYRRGGGEAFAEHLRPGADVTLRLEPTASVSGQLRGEAPDAFAVVLVDPKTMLSRADEFFRTGGRFSLAGVQAGTYELYIESPTGTATRTLELRPGEQLADLQIDLGEPGRVRGRAVDAETGAPLAGMRVWAASAAARTRFGAPNRELVTGPDGRFEVSGLLPGEAWVSVTPSDPAAMQEYTSGQTAVTVVAGATVDAPDIAVMHVPRGLDAPPLLPPPPPPAVLGP